MTPPPTHTQLGGGGDGGGAYSGLELGLGLYRHHSWWPMASNARAMVFRLEFVVRGTVHLKLNGSFYAFETRNATNIS